MSQPLKEALALVQREFPDALLTEVRLEFRMGERHDHPDRPSESWLKLEWTVQVDNGRESGATPTEAIAHLREEQARRAQVPGYAERIASILREVPDVGFSRSDVLMAVQNILDKGRQRAR